MKQCRSIPNIISKAFLGTILLGFLFLAPSCSDSVSVSQKGDLAVLKNEKVSLEFDLSSGTYSIRNLESNTIPVQGAVLKVNDWTSAVEGRRITWERESVSDALGEGLALILNIEADNQPLLTFSFSLYEGQGYMAVSGGVENTLGESIQIKTIYALSGGRVYEGLDISENFAMVDGFSGGVPLEYGRRLYNPLSRENALKSRNNILLTFGDDHVRHNLVMGGLTYFDYEKYATLVQSRHVELESGSDGTSSLLCYLNLPDDREVVSDSGESLKLVRGDRKHTWQNHEFKCIETATSVMDREGIVVEFTNLKKDSPYFLGFSWWRGLWHGDRKDHRQSVYVEFEKDGAVSRLPLIENKLLPRFDGILKEDVEQIELLIPMEAVRSGSFRLLVEHPGIDYENSAEDPNVYLSEVWLRDGGKKPLLPGELTQINDCTRPRRAFTAELYASDPVGKKVDPGVRYIPDDRFYIDVTTVDPFEALEQYGQMVSLAQDIELSIYDFPSVCLWYAEHRRFGGGAALNTTAGAVSEMETIKESGFLNYSRVAVRLVPHSYMPDNQQGWWDDEHWQRETEQSGFSQDGRIYVTHAGRHVAPYETSEKWGKAVTELGGIPLTYSQTSYRSEDYAKAFPEHMLFNKTYAWKGEPQDTTGDLFKTWNQAWTKNSRLWGYDFTDPDFLEHLRRVYTNLANGGIKGLMFDYPTSGWASAGGMEDEYSTTAAAYRTIFRKPFEILGPEAYVHERNMLMGHDVTIGYIASIRTENDTDLFDAITATRCGMRWYKNRVFYSQDTDSKNLVRLEGNRDNVRTVLTMAYVTTGRLLLANSFSQFSDETFWDLTRTFPSHTTNKSARPVDAFIREYPMVYDYKINDQWHQVTFFNTDIDDASIVSIALAGKAVNGALGLNADKAYHVYDFWNDHYIGMVEGSKSLEQTLRPGESRMMSVREVADHPQLLSTNRHIMQGYLDVEGVEWDQRSRTLSGTSKVVGGDPYVITIASNGSALKEVTSADAGVKIFISDDGDAIQKITIESPDNKSVKWNVVF